MMPPTSMSSRIAVVAFTGRNGRIRIISARPAEPIEKEMYHEHIKRAFGRDQKD